MAFWDFFVSKNNKGLTSSLTADAKPSFRIKIPQKSHIIAFNPAFSTKVQPKSQIPNPIAHFITNECFYDSYHVGLHPDCKIIRTKFENGLPIIPPESENNN
jgi:hypothetical protein